MPNTKDSPKLDATLAQDRLTEEAGESVSGATKADVDLLKYLMVGVIIVLFTAFVGIFISFIQQSIDAQAQKQATYEQLKDRVTEQNIKIDLLSKQVESLINKQEKSQETN